MGRPNGARAEAKQAGKRTYLADKPHVCGNRLRYTNNGVCVSCDKNRRDWNDDAFKAQHAARQRAYRDRAKAKPAMPVSDGTFDDILG